MVENIIKCFSEGEFNLLLKTLVKATRSKALAIALRKSTVPINKQDIFFKLFNKERTANNDYLLRNELSILKKKVELFIVQNYLVDAPANAVYYNQYALSVWCTKRNLNNEASKYLSKALEVALSENAWRGALLCTRLMGQLIQYSNISIDEKIAQLRTLADQHLYYLTQLVSKEVQLVNYINVGADKLAQASLVPLETNYAMIEDSIEIKISDTKDPLAKYYYLKSLGFLHKGNEAINYLVRSIELLNQPADLPDKDEEVLVTYASIALEYSMVGNFEMAKIYYKQIIASPLFNSFRSRNGILINYATTLIKLKEYEEAADYIEQITLKNAEPVVLSRVNTMKILVYLYTKNFNKLRKILPLKSPISEVPLKFYNKFLFVIYYLIQENYIDAQRILHNLIISKTGRENLYKPLISIYSSFLNFSMDQNSKNKIKLKSELASFNQTNDPKLNNIILSIWIRENIVKVIN